MSVELKEIKIKINDQEITLSIEDAKVLKKELDTLFKESISFVPYSVPVVHEDKWVTKKWWESDKWVITTTT